MPLLLLCHSLRSRHPQVIHQCQALTPEKNGHPPIQLKHPTLPSAPDSPPCVPPVLEHPSLVKTPLLCTPANVSCTFTLRRTQSTLESTVSPTPALGPLRCGLFSLPDPSYLWAVGGAGGFLCSPGSPSLPDTLLLLKFLPMPISRHQVNGDTPWSLRSSGSSPPRISWYIRYLSLAL